MSLKSESIKLKLEKAHLLLSEVDVLMDNRFYITAVSRLYYSCYHATKALLLTRDIMSKTHSGTAILLHRHFVKEGLFDADKAAFFSRLMNERNEDDYNDIVAISEDEVREFIEPAKLYVRYVEMLTIDYLERL